MLIVPDLRVGYQNIPKVATSSMFSWLYACVSLARTGKLPQTPSDDRKRERRAFLYPDSEDALATGVENIAVEVAPYQDYYRFALTRDPVRRFISMYANRVLFHRELSAQKQPIHAAMLATGLEPDPEINLLVDRFSAYCAVNRSIFHHARPMMDFLGPDLGVYQRIIDISGFDSCIDDMKRHFRAAGLDLVASDAPVPARLQTGGPKLGLDVLNPYSFEKLLDFYRADYEQVPTVNLQQTKDAYHKAREQVFVALAAAVASLGEEPVDAGKGQASSNDVVAENIPAPAGEAATATRDVVCIECPLVQKVRVAPEIDDGLLSGYVLLKPEAGYGFRLVLDTPTGTRTPEWGLPSPRLARSFPENPHAVKARFSIDGMVAGSGYELRVVGEDGESWPVARFFA